MSHFNATVSYYMVSPVQSIASDETVETAYQRLSALKVSGLPVVDGERLVGVVTRTDLLELGNRQAGSAKGADLLTFPQHTIDSIMTRDVVTLDPSARLAEAARLMVQKRIHRIFVADQGKLRGVISTKEVLRAIRDERVRQPLSELMRDSVYTIRANEPLSLAAERLEKAHVSGLIVVDDGWPVGVFSQTEALESRHLPREEPVEDAMSAAILCLRSDTPLHRAAAQAAVLDVRRIVVLDEKQIVGVLSGLDLARIAS